MIPKFQLNRTTCIFIYNCFSLTAVPMEMAIWTRTEWWTDRENRRLLFKYTNFKLNLSDKWSMFSLWIIAQRSLPQLQSGKFTFFLHCYLLSANTHIRTTSIYPSAGAWRVEISCWTLDRSKHYGCKYWRFSTDIKMSRKTPEGRLCSRESLSAFREAVDHPETAWCPHKPI